MSGARYKLDGEPTDLADFLAANTGPDCGEPFDAEDLRRIEALQPGEELRFGGGAAATFIFRREA